MRFLILLSDPVGHSKNFAAARISEQKADSCWTPLFTVAIP